MGRSRENRRHTVSRATVAAGVLTLVAACSAGGTGGAGTGPPEAAPSVAPAVPLTAELNQFRDNYSRQIVEIQLTNTSAAALTVTGARVRSPLFADGISWAGSPAGIELPPGQTKSLPAHLPAPVCAPAGTAEPGPAVAVRLAPAPGTAPEREHTITAADSYGVLTRNNADMCLARAADAVAGFRLEPGLEVSPDGLTAVVRLLVTPRDAASAGTASLTVERIEGTPLLAEDAAAPWPRGVPVHAGGEGRELRLGIRPARCDPHAVAEDKVGTLLPLRVTVGGRDGVLKVDAGPLLRGRIHDFVGAACSRQ